MRSPITTAVLLLLALGVSACTTTSPIYRGGRTPLLPPSDAADVDHRLLLIGDAGDADPDGEPALQLLARYVQKLPDRTTVAFLGDNIYERGMPEAGDSAAADKAAQASNFLFPTVFDSREEAESSLNAQIDTLRGTTARGIFLPGNHDWDPLEAGGWKRVLEQENFLRAASQSGAGVDVDIVPKGGCPGPVSVPLGKSGMLIALDSQWFLETAIENDVRNDKPCPEDNPTRCPCVTEEQVIGALVEQLRAAAEQGRWAIVAAHHPLNSAGPHFGVVEALTHLFPLRFMRHYVPWYVEWIPLPGLGTLAVVARSRFSPSPQDASNAANIHLRSLLRRAMADAEKQNAPTLVYAAGHDHSLQVFKTARGPYYSVVSGLGSTSRASEVGSTHNTLFAHANDRHPGFMQIDFLRNRGVRLSVIEADAGHDYGREMFTIMLADENTPRGPRPSQQKEGVWKRARQRASSAWRHIGTD